MMTTGPGCTMTAAEARRSADDLSLPAAGLFLAASAVLMQPRRSSADEQCTATSTSGSSSWQRPVVRQPAKSPPTLAAAPAVRAPKPSTSGSTSGSTRGGAGPQGGRQAARSPGSLPASPGGKPAQKVQDRVRARVQPAPALPTRPLLPPLTPPPPKPPVPRQQPGLGSPAKRRGTDDVVPAASQQGPITFLLGMLSTWPAPTAHKDRKRMEAYALNALLRMGDEARVAALLKARALGGADSQAVEPANQGV